MLRISQYRKDYASIWNNPSIKIDRKPFLWRSWLEGNLNKIGDLFKDGVFLSFQEISTHFSQKEKWDFWRYLQLKSCLRTSGIKPGEGENMIRLFFELHSSAHSASVLYNMVVDAQCGKYNNLRLIWQRDLNCDTEEDEWENIMANTGWSIRDVRGKFTHYKIIHRYYYMPVRLHKMGLIQNNLS